MKFLVVIAAAILATVSAETCDTTKLLPLLQDADLKSCTADSGLTLPPVGEIGKETLVKACASKGCQGLLAKVLALNLGDCSVGSFKLETNLITPLKSACASGASANSTAATTAPAATVGAAKETSSMAGSMAADMTMEPATTMPASGSAAAEKETTSAPAAGVPTPSPSKATSAASAVTVAAGAAVAAVAASLW